MSNVVENLVPYLTYRWAEYKAMKADEQIKRDTGEKAPESHALGIEKQFLSPKYEASVGSDFEDGLFDGVYLHSLLSRKKDCLSNAVARAHLHSDIEPN